MAWFLFMDESGHDHQNMPMEVRGGVAIHASKIWAFLQDFQKEEQKCFGLRLADYNIEIKGSRLLKKERYKWASNRFDMDEVARKKAIQRFLTRGSQEQQHEKGEFYAYGSACISMAKRIFALLKKHDAKLFASAIPRGTRKPKDLELDDYLRKDLVFLQERFCNFLELEKENGVLVMDQTDKKEDKRFLKNLENYYTKTVNGRKRAKLIVPYALFVDSEMSPLIQAADVCIYCINWGFRLSRWNFKGPQRDEIARDFGGLCNKLQFYSEVYSEKKDGMFDSYSIIFVESPYTGSENSIGSSKIKRR